MVFLCHIVCEKYYWMTELFFDRNVFLVDFMLNFTCYKFLLVEFLQ